MISDFKAGTKVCQAVLLRVQKIGNSSNGGVFARGLLEDNSGKMPFIVFEAGFVDKMRLMEGPKVMMVGGMVDINKFSNDMTLQLVLQRMEEIMPEDDITHLLPQGDPGSPSLTVWAMVWDTPRSWLSWLSSANCWVRARCLVSTS